MKRRGQRKEKKREKEKEITMKHFNASIKEGQHQKTLFYATTTYTLLKVIASAPHSQEKGFTMLISRDAVDEDDASNHEDEEEKEPKGDVMLTMLFGREYLARVRETKICR
jgi:hypothetical protein